MNRNENEISLALKQWLANIKNDQEILEELLQMKEDPKKAADAFYKDMEFGTGGLRGILGAGTNRMNLYTVARASMGVANYIIHKFPVKNRSVAISYDSRKNSELFAKTAAGVFAANGIAVHIYRELMPTPLLSFAVRQLNCSVGVMVTASHNPAEYNGYKVYGCDGCQITTTAAAEIFHEISSLDYFEGIKHTPFDKGVENKSIQYISAEIITEFLEEVKHQSLLSKDQKQIYKDLSIVYTPLNGTGLMPVSRVLRESGFSNIKIVAEQKQPDGRFPTCPYPNPEIKEALDLGICYAKQMGADILVATDPDCDRVGIAVRTKTGAYELLTANQTGVLLLDYICKQRIAAKTMPSNPIFMKTIVTTDLAEQVAESYGVKTVNVLTGFKYIGEQIGILEKENLTCNFIFGYEESYGYLSGSYVRDKDGVGASYLICEMAAFYKAAGKDLIEALEDIYRRFGRCLNRLHSYQFEGLEGFNHMQKVMAKLRQYKKGVAAGFLKWDTNELTETIGGKKIIGIKDFLEQKEYEISGEIKEISGIPSADVLVLRLEDNCSVVVRPSGTEPKLKVYVTANASDKGLDEEIEKRITESLEGIIFLS